MAIPGKIKGPRHLAADKLQQILAAGQEQLSDDEFSELLQLVEDFYRYGLTNWINCRLGELISQLDWELEVEESPEWSEALQACDGAFLLYELKNFCREMGLGTGGHKKILCRRLYMADYDPVVDIMQPIIDKAQKEVSRVPQTIIETTYDRAAGHSFRLEHQGWKGLGRYQSAEAAIADAKALGKAPEDITLIEWQGGYDLYVREKPLYPYTKPVEQLRERLAEMRERDPESFELRDREFQKFINHL